MIGIEVRGMRELDARLTGKVTKLKLAAAMELNLAMRDLLVAAQRECPVRTGRLRASHRLVSADKLKVQLIVTAPYAPYVHDGTSRQRANPWLYRAFLMEQGALQARMAQVARSLT